MNLADDIEKKRLEKEIESLKKVISKLKNEKENGTDHTEHSDKLKEILRDTTLIKTSEKIWTSVNEIESYLEAIYKVKTLATKKAVIPIPEKVTIDDLKDVLKWTLELSIKIDAALKSKNSEKEEEYKKEIESLSVKQEKTSRALYLAYGIIAIEIITAGLYFFPKWMA